MTAELKQSVSVAALLVGAALTGPLSPAPALAGGGAPATPPAVNQLPTGGTVAAGAAVISQSGNQLTVDQTTGRAVVNWDTFNVGANATVNFRQPDSGGATLNRVADPNPSQIYGRIQANGQVYLTNPNGVYFAPGASADVGGLVATTHSISNADFMAGKSTFERNGATGRVINEGTLKASLGGYIALLAPEVRNNGVIIAQMGTVALAAGDAYTLHFTGNATLADIQVTPATIKALVRNRQAVQAPGGLIILSAQAVDQIKGRIVNSGQLEASGLVSDGGAIRLTASSTIVNSGAIRADAAAGSSGNGGLGNGGLGNGGKVTLIANLDNKNSKTKVTGSISARGGAAGGKGGFVETSGGKVKIGDAAKVDTSAPSGKGKAGQWLIDPDGFTIASSGGDITGAALAANLATGDVSIASASGGGGGGDIDVNDAVAWSANKLTLTATNDININAVMTAKATASLDLEPGGGNVNVGFSSDGSFKGRVDFFQADGATPRSGTGFLTIGGNTFTVITSVGADAGSATGADLQGINGGLGDNYALGADINAATTSGWDSGAGFTPIGVISGTAVGFTGIFDGLGHTINGLTINRPSATYPVGVFGYGKGATIRNVGVVGGAIAGNDNTGALLGQAGGGVSVANVVNGYATATVSGGDNVGGLIGFHYGGALNRSYAAGSVSGSSSVGGLVGLADSPTISQVYATGAVSGASSVGGLIGKQTGGTLSDVYAAGAVTATGGAVGGLMGNNAGAVINRALAANDTTAPGANVGALIGSQSGGSTANAFYDSDKAGAKTGFGDSTTDAAGVVVGKTTTQLRDIATYQAAGWDIAVDTTLSAGYATQGFLLASATTKWAIGNMPVYVRLVAGGSTYGDTPSFSYAIYDAASGGNLITDAATSGTATWSTSLSGGADVGTYSATYVSGLSTSRTGYALNPGSGANWTISTRPITVRANDLTRTYGSANPSTDGATLVSGSMVNGDTLGGVSVSSSATSSTPAGQTAALVPSSLSLSSGNANNYSVTYNDGILTIDKAPLTVTANNATVTYNGGAYSGDNGVSYSGLANGEGASVLSGTLSYGGAARGAVNAGSYTISVSGLSSSNYDISYTDGALTINKAPLTITAADFSRNYDGQAFSGGNGVSYSGFVNGEGTSVLSGALSYGGASQGAVNAGNYMIIPGGLSASNYSISYADGALTINKAPLTITATDFSRNYNGQAFSGGNGVSYSGFVNGEGAPALTGALSYGGASQGAVNAGSYVLTPDGLSSSNYAITYVAGTLTIGKAPLTVTADDTSRPFGTANPLFTYAISGFVNGESIETAAISGAPALSTNANPATPVGLASIIASTGTLAATNYSFTTVDGVLTITAATNTITPTPTTATVTAGTGDSTATTTTSTTTTTPNTPAGIPTSSTQGTVVVLDAALTGQPTVTSSSGAAAETGSLPAVTAGASGNQQTAPLSAAISVNLVKAASPADSGVVSVSVPQEIISKTGGFTFKLPEQMTAGTASGVTITATTAEGAPLPAWLRFVPDSKTFVAANVPEGGLPISVAVFVDGKRTDMTIAERGQ